MSKKVITYLQPLDQEGGPRVFELRGHFVMLAASVAEVFNVETREIVQNIKLKMKNLVLFFMSVTLSKSISRNQLI